MNKTLVYNIEEIKKNGNCNLNNIGINNLPDSIYPTYLAEKIFVVDGDCAKIIKNRFHPFMKNLIIPTSEISQY